jgi:hypothetical protein
MILALRKAYDARIYEDIEDCNKHGRGIVATVRPVVATIRAEQDLDAGALAASSSGGTQ